jgi:hypothetical protein
MVRIQGPSLPDAVLRNLHLNKRRWPRLSQADPRKCVTLFIAPPPLPPLPFGYYPGDFYLQVAAPPGAGPFHDTQLFAGVYPLCRPPPLSMTTPPPPQPSFRPLTGQGGSLSIQGAHPPPASSE